MVNEEEFDKMINNTNRNLFKRNLILKFASDYEDIQIEKMNVVLVFKDDKLLKYMLLPKSIYRRYYLRLLTKFTEETIPIKRKDKDEIKSMLKVIYGDENLFYLIP